MPVEEVTIRLSVRDLKDLIHRAEYENYMLFHDEHGRWVRLVPYIEEKGE